MGKRMNLLLWSWRISWIYDKLMYATNIKVYIETMFELTLDLTALNPFLPLRLALYILLDASVLCDG